MKTNSNHDSLSAARKAKNDEFYTQYADIEKEMNAYLEYNADVFRDKVVLLPCDDPEWSSFTRYFAQNFERLGLKKLLSTSLAPAFSTQSESLEHHVDTGSLLYPACKSPFTFEEWEYIKRNSREEYDDYRATYCGRLLTLERDTNGDGRIDHADLTWEYLQGAGDFRCQEVQALRDQADFIITNPPFSLFREFLDWVLSGKKKPQFAIIGNMNAITYKEVFPLIKDNKIWLGVTRTGVGSMWFEVAKDAPERTGQKIENGKRLQTIGNSAWFTNIDHGRRHAPLTLMTEADNKKYSKHKQVRGAGYQKYDNYDAVEVPAVDAIPSDYTGVMGVPITFLGKYNPDQFEIVKFRKGDDDKDLRLADGTCPYFRILVRHKRDAKSQ